MTEWDTDWKEPDTWEYQGKRKDQLEKSPLCYIVFSVAALVIAFALVIKKIYF